MIPFVEICMYAKEKMKSDTRAKGGNEKRGGETPSYRPQNAKLKYAGNVRAWESRYSIITGLLHLHQLIPPGYATRNTYLPWVTLVPPL